MQIIYAKEFKSQLNIIVEFIARDSENNAKKFYADIMAEVDKTAFMSYGFRQNLDADDKNVQDLVFKGYVIPFYINKETKKITILSIYKENLPKIDF